ncbi:MAG TPA: DUF2254 domain-containing protein [Streptosporangiaceae bacterium]|jgi:uncharacterized membrane protein|nr:DUF2254 domain-containing protein [Streptosporangiaceae bacterium]
MRALPVPPEPLWRTDFRQRIAVSLWFLPTIYAAASIGVANLTIWLDSVVDAPIGVRPDLVSDPGTAATFAGAIAAATLAFVAVVFATTLVAIQLAASQYSPRTVRIFIRSRVTRITLGLFLATFVFSLIVLVSNRASVSSAKQFAPVVSVTALLALSLATVFGFVAYLHGVVRLMRVQYLLETIASESRRSIEENFPPASAYVDVEPPAPDPAAHRLCYTGTAGVITATDLHGLAELCRRNECWLELTVGVGEYLAHGTPIALVHGGDLHDRDVTRFFLIRGERTFVQDPAFGFRQLVDIAIRALSPAVNDPTTGVQAIDRISDLLAITGGRLDPTGLRVDSSGTVRVKRKLRNFEGLLVLALTEVIRYGADAPQVVRRLRGMLDELESTLSPERQAAIARQRDLLEAAVTAALPAPFSDVSSTADREGLG